MKSFIAFVAFVAIAVASPLVKPVPSDELEAIVAAINSPSTDPATAALLEQQLQDIIDALNPEPIAVGPVIIPEPIGVGPVIVPEPIAVGPAIIESEFEPIAVGPAIVEFPESDGGAVTAPIVPSPVIIGPIPEGAPTPLVQIILNINQGGSVVPAPVVFPEIKPEPVHVVDSAPEPVQVVEIAPEVVEIEPIQVIETAPVPVEPVIIGTPILPSPAVILPEELN